MMRFTAFVLVCCQSSDTTVIEGVGVDLSEFISDFNIIVVNYRTLVIMHSCNHQNALEVIAYY